MSKRTKPWGAQALSQLLGSDVRAGVVAWICSHPVQPVVGAELARELGMAASSVGLELSRLEKLGMLEVGNKMGRSKPYYLNESFPLLPALRSMVMYATGIVALLREKLGDRDDVDVAFIYGSLAAGDDRPESDVDVMVVGDISGRDLSSPIREVERATGREVNQVHYSRNEFARRARQGGSFLPTVLDGPKVFVKGNDDGLRELAR